LKSRSASSAKPNGLGLHRNPHPDHQKRYPLYEAGMHGKVDVKWYTAGSKGALATCSRAYAGCTGRWPPRPVSPSNSTVRPFLRPACTQASWSAAFPTISAVRRACGKSASHCTLRKSASQKSSNRLASAATKLSSRSSTTTPVCPCLSTVRSVSEIPATLASFSTVVTSCRGRSENGL
jgi:hypothetical protein